MRKRFRPWRRHHLRLAKPLIAAGVNVKALSEFLGHASITITLDRYGHLLPGSLAQAATLLDMYLEETGAQTGAQNEKALHNAISRPS
jgi:site-specific recombinase XerD